MSISQMISTFFTMALGCGGVVLMMGYIYKRDAVHWEYLAARYGRAWSKPLTERWGNAVLYGKFPVSKAYNGFTKIGVLHDGLAMQVRMPPYSFFCEPLFIPYSDIKGWNQTWFVNSRSVELELRHAPEVKIVMPREQIEWIRAMGGSKIQMNDQPSPHNDKPVVWHAILVTMGLLSLGLLGFVLIGGHVG